MPNLGKIAITIRIREVFFFRELLHFKKNDSEHLATYSLATEITISLPAKYLMCDFFKKTHMNLYKLIWV